ncbi:MAG: type IV secretory system conjugative DNA transfer family protein [Clostridium sp.]|uniref:VirD4-like conjugal transfer protein, CD1115 family n=1 Tax=Clostridium sp. TaxID=1506 RepID=UPI002A90BDED|nr:type IV secretory system conjugative DNA transfer family protein [Clostridium sp.]MDY6228817.1 type IV secretory system conjugative DNA transfer family protein [Clostridium sp.]
MKKEKIIFTSIIAILTFYILNRISFLYQNAIGNSIERIILSIDEFSNSILSNFFFIDTTPNSILTGLIGFIGVFLVFLYKAFERGNRMEGKEHGSAEWGNKQDIKPFMDIAYEKNMLLTQTEKMTINTRQTLRNNNIFVVGGSGSGKTRFFVKPNLMQLHTSYVTTDPKGTLLPECGKMLVDNGYKVKYFNTIDFEKSMHYNPFVYIKKEKDILKLVNTIMLNTNGEGEKCKEDFWVKAERLLYQALIGYIYYELPIEDRNFKALLYLLNQMEVKEDNEEFKSPIDIIFEELEEKDEDHFAVRQYKKYKMAAGKTAKSILISCGARLSPFDIKELREITEYDELELDTLGDNKQALFIIIDDTDSTFNFLVAILYTQMFNVLCNKADNEYKGRLPIHVRCLLDEFANIGRIPSFEKLIATVRSREISMVPIVQNMAQIKGLYKEQAGTIVGNCDTTLFLGSGEEETQKSISNRIGKTTIDHTSVNVSKGQSGSMSLNQQIIARDLITPAEVGLLKTDECILFIRGVKPFKSMKFKIEKHKRYKLLADYNEDNRFDVIKHKSRDILQDVKEIKELELVEEINNLIDEKEN